MGTIFDDSWKNISTIIMYGLGMIGKKYFDILKGEFNIKFIVDNNQDISANYKGVKVISLDEMLLLRESEKIIILASKNAYSSIKNDLDKNNFIEYKDYVHFDIFLSEWYWQVKRKNCIREVHMSINTNCTFNCEKCNMFIPYYKNTTVYTFTEIKQDLDIFFPLIDFVFVFSYLGGEPFLNHDLKDILEYTHENYHAKIGRIEIISNGSIIPDNGTLEVMGKYGILVRISDYTCNIKYEDKLSRFVEQLVSYGIEYSVEKNLEWVDFCFPYKDEKLKIAIKDVRTHMLCCSPAFHGLNDGKFYYCHVAWSAEKANLITLKDSDYIELSNCDQEDIQCGRRLVEYAGGNMKKGYVSLCEKCMGCGTDNHFVIPAGKQAQKHRFA